MTQIVHKELSYTVRGILLDVYNKLGPMLPEHFYQEAIALGLEAKGLSVRTEKPFEVYYRNNQVGLYYVDIWVNDGQIILELKVSPEITPLHRAQALSYLKVTNADLAIVVSYGAQSLLDERLPNFLRNKVADFVWEEHSTSRDRLYPELTDQLFKILHRVHFELGPGFLHQIYRRATMIELRHQGLAYQYIKQMPIRYEGHHLGFQEVRLIQVEAKVLLATIAVKQIDETMLAQLKARVRHLGLQLGLLANFNATALQVEAVRV